MRPTTCLATAALLLPLASGAAGGTTLRGNGVAVTLDLRGFEEELGAGPLHGSSWRLGQFSLERRAQTGEASLIISILVDEVPAGVGLDELRRHVLASEGERRGGAAPELPARPGGFFVGSLTELGPGFTQWHVHYHTLLGRKWVELHFSSVFGVGADLGGVRARISRIVDSMRVAAAPSTR